MKLRALCCSLLAIAAAGCGAQRAATPAVAAQGAPGSSAAAPRFVGSAALTPIALSCREAELPQPNALDDDCDGAVDGESSPVLTIALAYRRGAPVRIVLEGPEGARVIEPSCGDASGVCIARVRGDALPAGQSELRIESAGGDEAAYPSSVAVSKSGEGEVQAYLASLTHAGDQQPIGTLTRE